MNRFFITLAGSLLISANAFGQIDFKDNFDDGNVDGWAFVDLIGFATGEPHADVSLTDGIVRLHSPKAPSPELAPSGAAIDRLDLQFTDFEISIDVVENNSSLEGFFGIAGRVPAPFSGYGFTYGAIPDDVAPAGNVVSIVRGDPGQPATTLSELFLDDLPRDNIRMVFRAKGNTFTGDIYSLDDLNTSLARLDAQDDTYAHGGAGVFVFGGSPPPPNPPNFESFGDVRFDNYSLVATPVPEPSSIVLLAVGMVCLSNRIRKR